MVNNLRNKANRRATLRQLVLSVLLITTAYLILVPSQAHAAPTILVISQGDFIEGSDPERVRALLFRIDQNGRTEIVSDWGDRSQGDDRAMSAVGVAVSARGGAMAEAFPILVLDSNAGTCLDSPATGEPDPDCLNNPPGALFRVRPSDGRRIMIHDFGRGPQPRGVAPVDLAVETSGHILVVDRDAGPNPVPIGNQRSQEGVLFRISPDGATREVITLKERVGGTLFN
jgi:hypothetical protein